MNAARTASTLPAPPEPRDAMRRRLELGCILVARSHLGAVRVALLGHHYALAAWHWSAVRRERAQAAEYRRASRTRAEARTVSGLNLDGTPHFIGDRIPAREVFVGRRRRPVRWRTEGDQ